MIKYQQGCRDASELVSKQALQMREVIVRESGKTEKAIRTHVTQTSAKFEHKFEKFVEKSSIEQFRQMLLKSLKYPGMNERANNIETAHARTFRWLFADGKSLSKDANKNRNKLSEVVWSSFTDWLQSNLSVYWIMGKPGSGKSTLVKFILSEPRTKIALERWRPGTIKASHYFWRPGAQLQRSIKGMLCSLVHQLVNSIPNALDYALAHVIGLSQKDAETDWSLPELERLFIGLIRDCGQPLCLFIDGLDECGPEDSHQVLLALLDRVKSPNVKIIVSSRNEAIFENRFRHEPQLRVQDLTVRDLHIYARDMLPLDIEAELYNELVRKAEGVFLWLVLAVESINRGLTNDDPLRDLYARVRSLPEGLESLYEDMWERLNEDHKLYRESAALYFKLAMAALSERLHCVRHGFGALAMMLASHPKTHSVFAKSPAISMDKLLKECERFERRVQVCCAGLLRMPASERSQKFSEREEWEASLRRYGHQSTEFSFIHRSAQDFLTSTVAGQNILKHDGTSSEDIDMRILEAKLRAIELYDSILPDSLVHSGDFVIRIDRYVDVYLSDLSRIADVRHNAAREISSLCCELFSSSSLMDVEGGPYPIRIAVFLGRASAYPNLNPYSIFVIQKQCVGSGVRSAVLLDATSAALHQWRKYEGVINFELIRWLLSLPDVDTNLECPLLDASSSTRSKHMFISPLGCTIVSPFAWLLGGLLKNLTLLHMEKGRSQDQEHVFAGLLQLVCDFISHGANLRSKLFFIFSPEVSKLSPIPSNPGRHWCYDEYLEDVFVGVLALQASTVIEKILAWLSMAEWLQHDPEKDGNADELVSCLWQKCQELSCEANNCVIGFLQPGGNFDDLPYRQVSEQDSTHLIDVIWKWQFRNGEPAKNFKNECTKVLTRSPFSSVGFKDYMKDIGLFDELAARKLIMEYHAGIVTPLILERVDS